MHFFYTFKIAMHTGETLAREGGGGRWATAGEWVLCEIGLNEIREYVFL